MARTKNSGNDRVNRLEEGLAALAQAQSLLVQTQAAMVQNQAAFQAQIAETNREMAETRRQISELDRLSSERFRRVEAILLDHGRILAELTRLLQALPEAVREKIGFKMPQTPT